MNVPIRPDLSLFPKQQLRLSPRLQQSIMILEMPVMELRDFVNKELEENPLLEEQIPQENVPQTEDFEGELYEKLPEREVASPEPGLRSHLLFQLRLHVSSDQELIIGEEIIDNINEDGYLVASLEEIAQRLGVSLCDVEGVLRLIQTFEPTGVGARNLKECLLLQLKESERSSPLAQKIVENYLEWVPLRTQWKKIAQELNCNLKELREAFQEIKMLEPKPGRLFSSFSPSYIVPDLLVKKEGGEYRVYLNKEYLPQLTISPQYNQLMANPEAGKFLRKKLTSARWIIRCLEKRSETLEKVGAFLVKKQEGFLKNGERNLRPLSLREVGTALGMHESTISRAIRGKYIQTPFGIYPLKFFITGNLGGEERFSEAEIKEEIKRILRTENKEKPFSDEEIALLLKERGIALARRTVAKYRTELGIPSKSQRKE
jgi:RNA polymerase sigma-54 factor